MNSDFLPSLQSTHSATVALVITRKDSASKTLNPNIFIYNHNSHAFLLFHHILFHRDPKRVTWILQLIRISQPHLKFLPFFVNLNPSLSASSPLSFHYTHPTDSQSWAIIIWYLSVLWVAFSCRLYDWWGFHSRVCSHGSLKILYFSCFCSLSPVSLYSFSKSFFSCSSYALTPYWHLF